MFIEIAKKIFGSKNERAIKKLSHIITEINNLEIIVSKMSDLQLKNKTKEFKQRYQNGETLNELLPEAYAIVREAAKRTLNMRHFDVQLMGGIILHQGKITEMRTGEGKTLVATLPAYLNALTGDGVHIVTVNDYLAKRDAMWMKPIYDALDLTVGVITSNDMSKEAKLAAYKADITYGTNNEFGFDYLRDNMAFSKEDVVQRGLHYAIVDEVDSILIDEARTPLIISGSGQDNINAYKQINNLIKKLKLIQDFTIDEKNRQVTLTEQGHEKIEAILAKEGLIQVGSLYDVANINLVHHVHAALKAHFLFKRDVDYLVRDNEVIIIDEHTGRAMIGRRWSDGIHQAVEAKEGVKIQNESQTLASITFQNYFRLYHKLSGMTGTADTEAYEMQHIYNLEVVVMPTNVPCRRQDLPDVIYLKQEDKFAAILEDIKDCVKRRQPVLVGTSSIENSELLSSLLTKNKIKHQVLNAKFHEKEAEIIAEAGRPGSITIATNMAGRGTDIVLGGNLKAELAQANYEDPKQINKCKIEWQKRHDEVVALGGLKVIGSERHESRRIDNQLRGRCGRQGDPGVTRFYLSLEDNLMRIFISDTISLLLNKLGLEKNEAITHPLITRSVENAQRKVEGHNFDIRKQLLEFDDVANDQRMVIYNQRAELIAKDDFSENIKSMLHQELSKIIDEFIAPNSLIEDWNKLGLEECLLAEFDYRLSVEELLSKDSNLSAEDLKQEIITMFEELLAAKERIIGAEKMRYLEKVIMLNVLDNHWKEHLSTMDYLRQSIHLRGYAQKDPKQEYKLESFNLFSAMLAAIMREVIAALARVQVHQDTELDNVENNVLHLPDSIEYQHSSLLPQKDSTLEAKVGRNEPCPCGSGKKYKHCHGKL